MKSPGKALRLDEQVRAEDTLFASMQHVEDRKVVTWALGAAVVLHVIVFLIRLPEAKTVVPEQQPTRVIVVGKYVPPPKIAARQQLTRKMPLPDPTPDEPEPIREPEPEIDASGDITSPKLIPESRVPPEYPKLARVARREGSVLLQAIIRADGSVGDLEILRCNGPDIGFEAAAIAAVARWRYEPATQNGLPVEVSFTVFVDFRLQ